MAMQDQLRQAWAEALHDKMRVVQEVARTPAGKKFFALLEETFERKSLRGSGPYETYYNIGQRDLVEYLRELRDYDNE